MGGCSPPPQAEAVGHLRVSDAITDRRLLVRCLIVLAGVVVGFVLHSALHVQPSLVALLGAGAMVLVSRTRASEYLEEVEWATLVFFTGLFVLVGGLVQVGVIEAIGEAAAAAFGDRYLLAATGLVFGSAVLGAFVDNIPYTAAMAPIVEELVAAAPDPAHRPSSRGPGCAAPSPSFSRPSPSSRVCRTVTRSSTSSSPASSSSPSCKVQHFPPSPARCNSSPATAPANDTSRQRLGPPQRRATHAGDPTRIPAARRRPVRAPGFPPPPSSA